MSHGCHIPVFHSEYLFPYSLPTVEEILERQAAVAALQTRARALAQAQRETETGAELQKDKGLNQHKDKGYSDPQKDKGSTVTAEGSYVSGSGVGGGVSVSVGGGGSLAQSSSKDVRSEEKSGSGIRPTTGVTPKSPDLSGAPSLISSASTGLDGPPVLPEGLDVPSFVERNAEIVAMEQARVARMKAGMHLAYTIVHTPIHPLTLPLLFSSPPQSKSSSATLPPPLSLSHTLTPPLPPSHSSLSPSNPTTPPPLSPPLTPPLTTIL